MTTEQSLDVSDLASAARFYDPVLATLGFVREQSGDTAITYGRFGTAEKLRLGR